jgi:hypothetical protein
MRARCVITEIAANRKSKSPVWSTGAMPTCAQKIGVLRALFALK